MLVSTGTAPPGSRRVGIRVTGVVQGVGFRPTVFRLAEAAGLAGFVRNDGASVWIEVEGDRAESFASELLARAPTASRIDRLDVTRCEPRGDEGFSIARSAEDLPQEAPSIPPDLAPCDVCVAEMLDPAERRYLYPFTHCTSCGPRHALVESLPYDRDRTTMRSFPLCDACRSEYEDPRDRRFHAEPVACPSCGPTLQLVIHERVVSMGTEALAGAATAIADGAIVALKGVGGFVLACDATNAGIVAELRRRKHRPDKPFAVLAHAVEDLLRISRPSKHALETLRSAARPIVLVPATGEGVASNVAPGLGELGVFLSPSPLQFLMTALGPRVLVMTSGNASDEPIAITNDDAFERLEDIADMFLVHDREIAARADDSVVRMVADRPVVLRRARGYVPQSLVLPVSGPPILAVGGELKNTVCLAWNGSAVLSTHIGDLGQRSGYRAFEEAIAHLVKLAGVQPEAIAHDMHPDYRSRRWAEASGLPRVPVQHHHAHVASCFVEHGITGPAIGIAFDGTGYGLDGMMWGGEILVADLKGFVRLGHLRALRLVGGERAIREPWHLALAALLDAHEPIDLLAHHDRERLAQASGVWVQGFAVQATGAGRWFDAVASMVGVRDSVSWDGQAAAELEAIASSDAAGPYPFEIGGDRPFEVDLRPMIRSVASDVREGVATAIIAARFHETMAHVVLAGARRARSAVSIDAVVLTGGCFQNSRLSLRSRALLEADGFNVLTHGTVPPNDGGLALGQAAIASARLADV